MEKTEEFEKSQKGMSDKDLIEKAQAALSKLCETGGRSFCMTVPPRIDDTDMILGELINRFKKKLENGK